MSDYSGEIIVNKTLHNLVIENDPEITGQNCLVDYEGFLRRNVMKPKSLRFFCNFFPGCCGRKKKKKKTNNPLPPPSPFPLSTTDDSKKVSS